MKIRAGQFASTAAIGALLVGGLTAAPSQASDPVDLTAVTAAVSSERQAAFTGEEIFDGLFLGVGPVVEAHEEIILGTPETSVSQEDLDTLHAALKDDDPTFFTELADGVTSDDPYEVRSSLLNVNDQMKETFEVKANAGAVPNGPCGWSACGDVVAVVTVAVAALVLTIAVVVDAVPLSLDPDQVFRASADSSTQALALDEWVSSIVSTNIATK